MTYDEVVTKWSRNHKSALKNVLAFIEADSNVIIVPKSHYHHMVTTQIFNDLGFQLVEIRKVGGKKAFYKYKKQQ